MKAILSLQNFVARKVSNEKGMEMLQSILLIALAVGIATLLFAVFGADGGIVDTALNSLADKFTTWFR